MRLNSEFTGTVAGSLPQAESHAARPCRRCGIDLPAWRFTSDGQATKKLRENTNPELVLYCMDCRPYAKPDYLAG